MTNDFENITNYEEGIVVALDILGFSNLTSDEKQFNGIKCLYKKIVTIIETYSLNSFEGKFCYGSDSILMTYSKDLAASIGTLLDSIALWISLFRFIVNKEVGLDIRAAVTYGKYVHTGNMNSIFFGPSITRAFMLIEKKVFFEDFSSPYKEINPASIIFDNKLQQFHHISCIKATNFNTQYFYHLGNGYYALNPFVYIVKNCLTSIQMSKEQYIAFQNDILDKNKDHGEKYFLYKDLISAYNV